MTRLYKQYLQLLAKKKAAIKSWRAQREDKKRVAQQAKPTQQSIPEELGLQELERWQAESFGQTQMALTPL